MSSTKTAPKNGQEKKVIAKSNATTKETNKSLSKVDEILNPSATQRIKKLENFQLLAKKHVFLTNKKDELDKFIISSDGTKEKITLKNAEGYEFTVSNSQVVEKVVDVMKSQLDTFIQRSEKEVLQFNI